MKPASVRILTDNLPEQRFLEAILKSKIDQGEVEVGSYLLSDAAISIALKSLLEHPEHPIALVLNADTKDAQKAAEDRGSVERILASAWPWNWYVALVVPKVGEWAQADPRIKKAFHSSESTKKNYYEQAVRIGRLVQEEPFNLDSLRKVSPEFRELEDFISRTPVTPETVAKGGRR